MAFLQTKSSIAADPHTVTTGPWTELGDAARAVREAVFVIEQNIAREEEWDEWDAPSLHAVAYDAAGNPIGTGRLLPPGFGHTGDKGCRGQQAKRARSQKRRSVIAHESTYAARAERGQGSSDLVGCA